MDKIVADTNIYISALLTNGLPSRFIILAKQKEIELYISNFILEEIKGVLKKKFNSSSIDIAKVVKKINSFTTIVKPNVVINIIKDDPLDNHILECAVTAKAHVVVSGDRHLLNIKKYKKISIFTVREYLDAKGII